MIKLPEKSGFATNNCILFIFLRYPVPPHEKALGNKSAYYYEVHGLGDVNVYFVDLNNDVLRITVNYAGTEGDVSDYLSLATQILSTFQFINSTPLPLSTGWSSINKSNCEGKGGRQYNLGTCFDITKEDCEEIPSSNFGYCNAIPGYKGKCETYCSGPVS